MSIVPHFQYFIITLPHLEAQTRLCASAHLSICAIALLSNCVLPHIHFCIQLHPIKPHFSFPPTKSGGASGLLPAVLCSHSLIVKWFGVALYLPPAGSILSRRRLDTALQNAFPIWLSSVPETDRPYPVLLRKKLPEYLSGLRH